MTDETVARKQAVTTILKGVAKKTALLASAAAAGLLVYNFLLGGDPRWWLPPAGVLFGAALGLLNFRWLAIAVERVYLRQGATPGLSNLAAAIIGVLKLSLIFIVLFVVIKFRMLNVLGMMAGLSSCFLAILWEGVTVMKRNLANSA